MGHLISATNHWEMQSESLPFCEPRPLRCKNGMIVLVHDQGPFHSDLASLGADAEASVFSSELWYTTESALKTNASLKSIKVNTHQSTQGYLKLPSLLC